jgi:hypothetical protein
MSQNQSPPTQSREFPGCQTAPHETVRTPHQYTNPFHQPDFRLLDIFVSIDRFPLLQWSIGFDHLLPTASEQFILHCLLVSLTTPFFNIGWISSVLSFFSCLPLLTVDIDWHRA